MSSYKPRWGNRSIKMPTPPPDMYMPTGPVRGRFREVSPRNFNASPTIQRVQHRGRNVNYANTAEQYKRMRMEATLVVHFIYQCQNH